MSLQVSIHTCMNKNKKRNLLFHTKSQAVCEILSIQYLYRTCIRYQVWEIVEKLLKEQYIIKHNKYRQTIRLSLSNSITSW